MLDYLFNVPATTGIYTLSLTRRSSDLRSRGWSLSPRWPISPASPRVCGSAPPCCCPRSRSEEHTSVLQSRRDDVCRLQHKKKKDFELLKTKDAQESVIKQDGDENDMFA